MRVVTRQGGVLICCLLAVVAAGAGLSQLAWGARRSVSPQAEPIPPRPKSTLAAGWRVVPLRALPEKIATLHASRGIDNLGDAYVLAGTTGVGMMLRFHPETSQGLMVMASGMGDRVSHGNCAVNRVLTGDMDGDGEIETLATTSQILPIGHPRLYAWSGTTLEGVVAPKIASSWSHGLAVVPGAGVSVSRLFVTYCGYGEVVEFQLGRGEADGGFQSRSPGWKQVATLPHSGEQVEAADVDNDGRIDLVLASGFAINEASLRVCSPGDRPGDPLETRHVIDEDGRFGNVRFLVGDLAGVGTRELVAWWCTDLAGGDCEVIRYHLTPEGVSHREVIAKGPASRLWPDDNQAALGDLDGDGREELWFATHAGSLWRYDPDGRSSPVLVGTFPKGLGPIAMVRRADAGRPDRLLIGQDRVLFRLESSRL